MDWGSPLAALATALGIGLLIGAVRERQHGDPIAREVKQVRLKTIHIR